MTHNIEEMRQPNIKEEFYYVGLGYDILIIMIMLALGCALTRRWPAIWLMFAVSWLISVGFYGYFAIYRWLQASHGVI